MDPTQAENYQKLSDAQTERQTAILVNCRNNTAQCYSRQGRVAEAMDQLAEVLKLEVRTTTSQPQPCPRSISNALCGCSLWGVVYGCVSR
eukprot:COSAG05_NODE_604_length_8399_cov_6.936145_5_plen_90_part_00